MKKIIFILALVLSGSIIFAGGTKEESVSSSESLKEVSMNEDGTINNPEDVDVDPNKLVLWSLFSGGDGEYFDQIVKEYNETNPPKQVQTIMLVWGDYYTKLMTGVAANKGPDIGVSHVSRLPLLYTQGILTSIEKYAKNSGVNWNNFTDNMNNSVIYDNEHYAMPLDTHAEILYFNTDWLEKAGIKLQNGKLEISSTKDFEDILNKLKSVAKDGQSPLALTQQGDDPFRIWWAIYFQMNGPQIVNSDSTKITLDKDIAIKAAKYLKSLYEKGYILKGIQDHQKMFQTGNAGLEFGGTWATGVYEKTENLNFGAQAMPKLFDNSSCWADAHTLIIPVNKNRTEEETQAAVDFINFVSSKAAATWSLSGQIPSNVQVQNSQEYMDLPYRSDYKLAASTAVLPPQSEYYNALNVVIISHLDKYLSDQVTAEEAINNMIEEMQGELI